MKTTKILALILAVLMAVGCLAACGGGTGNQGGNDGDGGEAGVFEPWSAEDIAQMGEWIKEEAAGGTITLKVWQPDAAVAVFTEQTKRFIDIRFPSAHSMQWSLTPARPKLHRARRGRLPASIKPGGANYVLVLSS